MGATRWKVFTSVTFPLLLPGLGNAFLVTFIESVADFANPMLIGGSYDTLATTITSRRSEREAVAESRSLSISSLMAESFAI